MSDFSQDERFCGINKGSRVYVQANKCEGTVHFVGLHVSKGTPRLGVELDAAVGKLDGEQGGHRYFTCAPKFGVLTAPSKVTLIAPGPKLDSRGDIICENSGGDGDADSYATILPDFIANAPKAKGGGAVVADDVYANTPGQALPEPVAPAPPSPPPAVTKSGKRLSLLSPRERLEALRSLDQELDAAVVPRGRISSGSGSMPVARQSSGSFGRPVSAGGGGIKRNVGRHVSTKQPMTRPMLDKERHTGARFDHPAFVRGMDHPTTQRYVLGCMHGDYLIRQSSSSNNLVLCVNDKGTLANYTIAIVGTQFVLQDHKFSVLSDLIAFASKNLTSFVRPGHLLRLCLPAETSSWFVGEAKKAEVDDAVHTATQGQFLVRKSSAGDKFVVAVHDCNQVANFMIEPYPTTISTEKYSFAGRLFISIKNVIEWLMLNPVRGLTTDQLSITSEAPFVHPVTASPTSATLRRSSGAQRDSMVPPVMRPVSTSPPDVTGVSEVGENDDVATELPAGFGDLGDESDDDGEFDI